MQIGKSALQFFGILLLTGFLWLFFFVSRSILEENANENLSYIPKNATIAIRLDGRELAESTLFSIFLESKDEDVIKLLLEVAKKKSGKDGASKNFGIDYLSDIVVFQMPYKEGTIQGFTFNLINQGIFERNMAEFMKDSGGCAANSEVGMVLTYEGKKNILSAELNALAKKLLIKPRQVELNKLIAHHGHGKFVELFKQSDKSSKGNFYDRSNFLFALDGQELNISGNLLLSTEGKKHAFSAQKQLEPKGLHITSALFPDQFNDTLHTALKQLEMDLPAIHSFSLNYFGAKVINHSSGFFVVPQIELIVTLQESMDIKAFLSSEKITGLLDCSVERDFIKIQEEVLYYKQLDQRSFYIGISQNPSIRTGKSSEILSVIGDLKPLVSIQGGGLMTSFLEMMPLFRASSNLAEHTDRIHFSMVKSAGGVVKTKGNLSFIKGCSPMNELMKFLLVGQFFE